MRGQAGSTRGLKTPALIVDDDPQIRKRFALRLNAPCRGVASFEEAIVALDMTDMWLVVVVDMWLHDNPEGERVARWLQQHRPHIPWVGVSGGTRPRTIPEDRFLVKPAAVSELSSYVRHVPTPRVSHHIADRTDYGTKLQWVAAAVGASPAEARALQAETNNDHRQQMAAECGVSLAAFKERQRMLTERTGHSSRTVARRIIDARYPLRDVLPDWSDAWSESDPESTG